MRQVAIYAGVLTMVGAIIATAQAPPQVESPLDPIMKRIGPTSGKLFDLVAVGENADARTRIPELRKDFSEVEALFTTWKQQQGVKFAKDALARLEALDTALAAAPPKPTVTGTYTGTADVDAAMRERVSPAAAALGKAI